MSTIDLTWKFQTKKWRGQNSMVLFQEKNNHHKYKHNFTIILEVKWLNGKEQSYVLTVLMNRLNTLNTKRVKTMIKTLKNLTKHSNTPKTKLLSLNNTRVKYIFEWPRGSKSTKKWNFLTENPISFFGLTTFILTKTNSSSTNFIEVTKFSSVAASNVYELVCHK